MKYIILLNDKPIEEATQEERQKLDEKAKNAFEMYLGINYKDKEQKVI